MTADQPRLQALLLREQQAFVAHHPRCEQHFRQGEAHYLYGAPSHWMRRWAGGFPLSIESAVGAHVRCADQHVFSDFCLGDTGAMCGHAPAAVTAAASAQLARGATHMMPTIDATWVGRELGHQFGLPYWGFTTSATDANRAALRIARMITGRDRVLVFNGCYHGSVEEAHVALVDGRRVMRNGIHPNAVDHERVSAVVEFNDVQALERELARGDIACVLTEPMMTNYGMIAPLPQFHSQLRALCTRYDSLLILDETHTLSSGPGGFARSHGLQPDMLVLGKAIGGGIPVGLYGLSQPVAERLWALVPRVNPIEVKQSAHLGFGGTLAGSALQVAAVRAVLESVLTASAFEHMIGLADQLARDLRYLYQSHDLPWHVEQAGARVEIMFTPRAARDAAEVARCRQPQLDGLIHLYLMNRGVLITPFHCMMLMCPATTAGDTARLVTHLSELCQELTST